MSTGIFIEDVMSCGFVVDHWGVPHWINIKAGYREMTIRWVQHYQQEIVLGG